MRKTNSLLVCMIGLIMLFGPMQSVAQDLPSAISLTKSQQYETAETAFRTLITNEPANGNNYFYFAENYLRQYLADTITVTLKETSDLVIPLFQKGTEVDSANALNYVGLGRMALLNKDVATANKYFAKAKSMLPAYKKVTKIKEPQKHALVLAKLGEAQIVRNYVDTAKALPYVREAQLIDPTNPEIFIIAGDVFMLINDASTAIKNYNRAKDLRPNSCSASIKIGNIYVRAENLQVAIPYFEDAIKIDAKFAPAYRELGELYNLAGQYEKAKKNFIKYLELSGDNMPAKVKYVNSLYKSKDYDEAIKNIEEILAIDKSKSYLIRLAAYCYYDKKKPDYNKSLSYIEDFLKQTTADKVISKDYLYHGRSILKIYQDYNRAGMDTMRLRNDYRRFSDELAKAKTPKQKDALKNKMDSVSNKLAPIVQKMKQDSTAAEVGFTKLLYAFNMDTTKYEILDEIASFYYIYKRFNESANYYIKVIQHDDQFSSSNHMQLGRAYYQAKDFTKAEQIFIKVTENKSDYVPGFVWLANTNASLDPDSKLGLAKPKYELVIQKASADSVKYANDMFNSFGYLASYYYLVEQNYDQAKVYFSRMIGLDPKNKANQVKGYSGMALVYTKAKDYGKARECYNKILELDPKNLDAPKALKDLDKMK